MSAAPVSMKMVSVANLATGLTNVDGDTLTHSDALSMRTWT